MKRTYHIAAFLAFFLGCKAEVAKDTAGETVIKTGDVQVITCYVRACDLSGCQDSEQCFDAAGNPPPEGWYPKPACESEANQKKAEECGLQFCCDKEP